jgi:hypothetical protein
MRTVPRYYTANDESVLAYEDSDLMRVRAVFQAAESKWYDEWVDQGSTDEGTCCGGKGIQVWHVKKGSRVAKRRTVISAPPVQGNVSAARSKDGALNYLKEHGIDAYYYDGWMD